MEVASGRGAGGEGLMDWWICGLVTEGATGAGGEIGAIGGSDGECGSLNGVSPDTRPSGRGSRRLLRGLILDLGVGGGSGCGANGGELPEIEGPYSLRFDAAS